MQLYNNIGFRCKLSFSFKPRCLTHFFFSALCPLLTKCLLIVLQKLLKVKICWTGNWWFSSIFRIYFAKQIHNVLRRHALVILRRLSRQLLLMILFLRFRFGRSCTMALLKCVLSSIILLHWVLCFRVDFRCVTQIILIVTWHIIIVNCNTIVELAYWYLFLLVRNILILLFLVLSLSQAATFYYIQSHMVFQLYVYCRHYNFSLVLARIRVLNLLGGTLI